MLVIGCSGEQAPSLFEKVTPNQSGVTFSNELETTPGFNILNYLYFYDGGGVSIGDINNDDYAELLMGGNLNNAKPEVRRYDASYGDMLSLQGDSLQTVDYFKSDFEVEGEVRSMVCIERPEKSSIIVVARNDDAPKFLS